MDIISKIAVGEIDKRFYLRNHIRIYQIILAKSIAIKETIHSTLKALLLGTMPMNIQYQLHRKSLHNLLYLILHTEQLRQSSWLLHMPASIQVISI